MEDVLVFVAFLLVSGAVWLISRLGRAAATEAQVGQRGASPHPAGAAPPLPPLPPSRPPLTAAAALRPAPEGGRRRLVRSPLGSPIGTRRRTRPRPVSRARAREGIILRAILGPCRGLDARDPSAQVAAVARRAATV